MPNAEALKAEALTRELRKAQSPKPKAKANQKSTRTPN
jgi:hypothetical protein